MKKKFMLLIFANMSFGASIGRAVLKNAPNVLKESSRNIVTSVGPKISQGAESRAVSVTKAAYDASRFKKIVPPSKSHIDIVNNRISENLKNSLTVHEFYRPIHTRSLNIQVSGSKAQSPHAFINYNKNKSGVSSILDIGGYMPTTRFSYELL